MFHLRRQFAFLTLAALIPIGTACAQANPAITGPLTVSSNARYFKDPSGRVLLLNGSQTWNTLQDWGTDGAAQALDFSAFVKFLTDHGHNFTLLWRVEQPRFCNLPIAAATPPDFTVSPQPWQRTGPGNATDGGLKFDLSKFDQSYFDRLRSRTQALNKAGIYAGIYLFTGEFLNLFRCAGDGYPLSGANNVNGVDDGYTGGPQGNGSIDMKETNAITKYQDAFTDKVIDTLNDLPNVLWIVSEEAPPTSLWWNNHVIAHVKAYESHKRYQHPVGYAAPIKVPDSVIYNSDADWVAPGATISPTSTCGTGKPACKVNVNDSDHSYWEMWLLTPLQNRNYIWENTLNGNSVLFMDPYLVYYPREDRNDCQSPTRGICSGPDMRYEVFRKNLGYAVKLAGRMNLAKAVPQPSLSSTGYCLAQTPATGAEYLVYSPKGGRFEVDLSAMPSSRRLSVEWLNPTTGETVAQDTVPAGSHGQSFTPPFSGDAVLYLADTAGHATGR
jgi:hypothetical protein